MMILGLAPVQSIGLGGRMHQMISSRIHMVGSGFSTEIMDSGGGMMSTAKALVQFANEYPVGGIGKGRVQASRNGSMAGTRSMVICPWRWI